MFRTIRYIEPELHSEGKFQSLSRRHKDEVFLDPFRKGLCNTYRDVSLECKKKKRKPKTLEIPSRMSLGLRTEFLNVGKGRG